MSFLDKIKDLFSDEEEVIETKEVEVEEKKEDVLPTFMRNKIEEEKKREEARKAKESVIATPVDVVSDREVVKTRTSGFTFPIEMDEEEPPKAFHANPNVLTRERKEKTVRELYTKKEEPLPKKFKPTPVISPVYGVLDKNYTKDEVKVQDEDSYEIQRPSRKVDFETVRNKAFGTLTDDIRNNLCENCEYYKEVKITKNYDKVKNSDLEKDLLNNMTEEKEDISLGDAEDNYYDFGVSYEPNTNPPRREEKAPVINIDEVEINNDIKIINHNDEDSVAEEIELKEEPVKEVPHEEEEEDNIFLKPRKRPARRVKEEVKEEIEDTKEFEKMTHDEEDITSILGEDDDIPVSNDIFNLIDSMYDEEEK